MIHIRCGDDMREPFAASGLPGRFVRWAGALCQGPTPQGLSDAEWTAVRGDFVSENYDRSPDAAARFQADQDAERDAALDEDEIVLWFEHDLFDQIELIALLDWAAGHSIEPSRLRLICIDRFPGIKPFHGIGQLGPDQLAALFPQRRAVTEDQIGLAKRAWAMFRAPIPAGLETLLTEDTSALPFLAGAILRHLEDFPALRGGLARTELQALMAVQDEPKTAGQVFAANQSMEEAQWCGDLMFWPWLKRLASGRAPLLEIAGPGGWSRRREGIKQTRVSLTRAGIAGREGAADHVTLNGSDRWMGGVRLMGEDSPWRWDAMQRRLVETEGR